MKASGSLRAGTSRCSSTRTVRWRSSGSGEPALGGLALSFTGFFPPPEELERLATFGSRAAHALRAGERTARLAQELERSTALLEVVGQAIAELSLVAHTGNGDRARHGAARHAACGRLSPIGSRARDRGPARPGRAAPPRRRGAARPDPRPTQDARRPRAPRRRRPTRRSRRVRDAVSEAGVEAIVSVPSARRERVDRRCWSPTSRAAAAWTGTSPRSSAPWPGSWPSRCRTPACTSRRCGSRATAQTRSSRSGGRPAGWRRSSRSHGRSARASTLEQTVEAITKTAVELLDVDAAVLRLPEGRGDDLVARSIHIPDEKLAGALGPILRRPQPIARLHGARPRPGAKGARARPGHRGAPRRRPRAARAVPADGARAR